MNVVVNRTTPPARAGQGWPTFVIASDDTVTVPAHRASVLPDGQLLPVAADVTVLDKILFPVSGFFTVTENVIVAVAVSGATSPSSSGSGW